MDNGSINTIESSQGVRQGDILAMLLFALSMSAPVNEALLATPTAIPIGYADDINGVGPPREVVKFRNELQRIFRRENIVFNADKDLFTYLHADSSPLPQLVTSAIPPNIVAEKISMILGVPIGQDDEAISRFCVSQVEKHIPFFDVPIHPLLSPQHAFLLLRLCGIPRMNYLARTVYPGRLSAAAALFDKLAMGAAANVANIKLSENDEARKIFSLPISSGGFGIRSMALVAPLAFWSSMAQLSPRLTTLLSGRCFPHVSAIARFLSPSLPGPIPRVPGITPEISVTSNSSTSSSSIAPSALSISRSNGSTSTSSSSSTRTSSSSSSDSSSSALPGISSSISSNNAASNKSPHRFASLYAVNHESTSDSAVSQLEYVRLQQQTVLGTELKTVDPVAFEEYQEFHLRDNPSSVAPHMASRTPPFPYASSLAPLIPQLALPPPHFSPAIQSPVSHDPPSAHNPAMPPPAAHDPLSPIEHSQPANANDLLQSAFFKALLSSYKYIRTACGDMKGKDLLPPSALDLCRFYSDNPVSQLQKSLTALAEQRIVASLGSSASKKYKTRLLSCRGPNAGAWISCSPSASRLLSPDEFRLACRLRVGLPLIDLPPYCMCGSSLAEDTTHHLSRNRMSGSRTFRHDSVVQALMTWASRAGATVTHEPQHLFVSSNRRADILVVLGPLRFLVDVVITHPASPSYLNGPMATHSNPLVVAKSRETLKINSYSHLHSQSSAAFVPFACETYEAIGPSAHEFAKRLALHAAQFTKWSYAAFLRELLSDVGIAIQRGNVLLCSNGAQQAWSVVDMA